MEDSASVGDDRSWFRLSVVACKIESLEPFSMGPKCKGEMEDEALRGVPPAAEPATMAVRWRGWMAWASCLES
jgi:hypothetical protein